MKPVGVIPCGGASRRMGRDKALMAVDHASFVQRCVDDMAPVCARLYLLAAPGQKLAVNGDVHTVHDERAFQGPASALVRFARSIADDWLLVRAVDMPFARSADFLSRVNETDIEAVDVVMAEVDGRDQPLLALYRRGALARVDVSVPCSMFALLESMRVRRIAFSGPAWRNINRPEDMDPAEAAA